jgi:hypothetical protein
VRAQQSRTDVLPLTWEWPAAIAGGWLLTSIAVVPFAEALAAASAGRGWAMPEIGEAFRRLTTGALTTFACVALAVLETVVLLAAGWVTSVWWRTAGPGAQFGLATRRDVEAVLGSAALRRRRTTIRPDMAGHR